jgi:signal transduction histidine kinase
MEQKGKKSIRAILIRYNLTLVACFISNILVIIWLESIILNRTYQTKADAIWQLSLFLFLIILELFLLAVILGKKIKKEISKLSFVMKRLGSENLEVVIGNSDILEVDKLLRTLERMQKELTASLTKQWKAEEKKNACIAALAHDLKTPLTLIKGNTELLEETEQTKKQEVYTNNILKNIVKIQQYVDLVLFVMRSEKEIAYELQEVKISELISWMKVSFEMLANQKNVTLEYIIEEMEEELICDTFQLERAITNVVENAVDYAAEKGSGRVRLQILRKEALYIIVEDSGRGFQEEELCHSQDMFFEGDKSRSRKGHYGLGLYISTTILNKHGGSLKLGNSRELGGAKVELIIKGRKR